MNINTLDLNLLRVFDALYTERNVTRAGKQLNMAQPSVSNALNRLRDVFDDSLFVREPRGVAPTAYADWLAPRISHALSLVKALANGPAEFDPATATGQITIACSDNTTISHGSRLVSVLANRAPGVDVRFRPMDKRRAFEELDADIAQLVIGVFGDNTPARFYRKPLCKDRFVCIARQGHPGIRRRLTRTRFAALPHILMTLNADERGVIDRVLEQQGLARRVAMTVGQFLCVPELVAHSDCIASIPETLANTVAERAGCQCYPLPIDVPPWTTSLLWTQAGNAAPLTRYIVELLLADEESTRGDSLS